ncbi:MAG: hypothetical protein HGB02_03815 [Chlorobiaceae bacterium]|nr:hypothetical protein [Chlorobiaceae bacterium]
MAIEQPSGRIFWRREDKTNLQKYVRLETQHLHLHRGVVWAFYHERKGAHHIDVMGHDISIDGTSQDEVYRILDYWIDNGKLPPKRRQQRRGTKHGLSFSERIKVQPLPTKEIKVSSSYCHWNIHKECYHVSIPVRIDGKLRTIYGGYYKTEDEGRRMCIQACHDINHEIANRRASLSDN